VAEKYIRDTIFYKNSDPTDANKYATMHSKILPYYQSTIPYSNTVIPAYRDVEVMLSNYPNKPFESTGFSLDSQAFYSMNELNNDTLNNDTLNNDTKTKGDSLPTNKEEEDTGEDNPGITIPVSFYSHRVTEEIKYSYRINPRSKEPSQYATLMPADTIAWNSLIMLPFSAIRNSASNLGTTSIYDRANLTAQNQQIYRFKLFGGKDAASNIADRPISLNQSKSLKNKDWDMNGMVHLRMAEGDETDVLYGKERVYSLFRNAFPDKNAIIDTYLPLFFAENVHLKVLSVPALKNKP